MKRQEKYLIHCNKNQLMRIRMHLTNFPSCSPNMFVQLVSHACLQSRSANFCDVDMSSEMCHTSKKGQHFRRFPQGSDEHFDFSSLNFVLQHDSRKNMTVFDNIVFNWVCINIGNDKCSLKMKKNIVNKYDRLFCKRKVNYSVKNLFIILKDSGKFFCFMCSD